MKGAILLEILVPPAWLYDYGDHGIASEFPCFLATGWAKQGFPCMLHLVWESFVRFFLGGAVGAY